jgi:hypothetical protein
MSLFLYKIINFFFGLAKILKSNPKINQSLTKLIQEQTIVMGKNIIHHCIR